MKPTQQQLIYIAGEEVFLRTNNASRFTIFRDAHGAAWYCFAELFSSFGLDLNTEDRDGFDYFHSLPSAEIVLFNDIALVSERGAYLLAMQSPIKSFQNFIVQMIGQGIECVINSSKPFGPPPLPPEEREKLDRQWRRGFVYLVRHVARGIFKIGQTRDLKKRMKMLGTQFFFDEIVLEHSMECADRKAVEAALHQRFADKRIKGEWFALTPGDVNEIKSIERM